MTHDIDDPAREGAEVGRDGGSGGGRAPGGAGEVFVCIVASLLFAGLIYSVQGILHPLVALGALLIATYPFRKEKWARYATRAGIFLVALWLLYRLREMLMPFVVAFALAYVLDPVVDGLCGGWKLFRRLRIRRWLASLIVIGAIGLIGLSIGAQLGNMVIGQADELAALVQTAEEQLQTLASSSQMEDNTLAQRAVHGVIDAVEEITARLPELARGLASRLGLAIASFFGALLTFVLLFYALKDFDMLVRLVKERYLPQSAVRLLDGRIAQIDRTLKAFIGGYVLTSLFVGAMTLGILLLFGYRGVALLLAVITGLLNIIPVIGFWVSAAMIFVVGLAKGFPLLTLGLLTLCLGALNIVEGNFLQPRIIGKRVGLHPLFFILGVAVFAKLLGIAGAVIGVPLAAIISQEWQHFLDRSRSDPERA